MTTKSKPQAMNNFGTFYVYTTLDHMWRDGLSHILNFGEANGSRDGDTIEVIGWNACITDITTNFLQCPVRNLSPVYAAAEVLWYLSGTNSIEMIKAYAPQYERFANDGIAHGAYGYRMKYGEPFYMEMLANATHIRDQIDAVIKILMATPDSRQAVISLWESSDLIHAYRKSVKDIPCTLNVQFLLRNGRLHCHVNMRSNDVWLGTPYDIFAWTTIQRMIADVLGVEYGRYVHNVGSFHLYRRNEPKARQVQDVAYMSYPIRSSHVHDWRPFVMQDIKLALDVEYQFRSGLANSVEDLPKELVAFLGTRCMMADLAILCASKFSPRMKDLFTSMAFKKE